MENLFTIHRVENNIEILAKIVQATAVKYDCRMYIGYQNGKLQTDFCGEEIYKPQIVADVLEIVC